MQLTIRETAALTGVSVRTLHYYDAISLLRPEYVNPQNGYRYYGTASLERLQQILFYRELDFSLKEIAAILSAPDYDKTQALIRQKSLLLMKKERLERLLRTLNQAMEGEDTMNFEAFDQSAYEAKKAEYQAEVKERWGDTAAYRENQTKTGTQNPSKQRAGEAAGEQILQQFGVLLQNGSVPASQETQQLVKQWQDYITEYHYTCTKEILAGLALMYTEDERFTAHIDQYGTGTAAFLGEAISIYCGT